MKVEWDGEDYELDIDDMDTVQARYIQRETGFTPTELWEGLFKADAMAVGATYWLMLNQSGKPIKDIRNINIKVVRYAEAVIKAYAEELGIDVEGKEAEGDPKDNSE